jgi:hypothetical protein
MACFLCLALTHVLAFFGLAVPSGSGTVINAALRVHPHFDFFLLSLILRGGSRPQHNSVHEEHQRIGAKPEPLGGAG